MPEFLAIVSVKTDTYEHARQVFDERIRHDEQYVDEDGNAFEYTIDFNKVVEAIE